MTIKSSQAAVDLIVASEVSSEAAYDKNYQHPTWPGGMSGVTIGIGYDVGYASANTIRSDWGDKLPAHMVNELVHVAGIHGSPASSAAHALKDTVSVPYTAAMEVFIQRDMPKWEDIVSRALENTGLLSGDSFGALVSLAYNRGASFSLSGDRYREMRAIRDHMATKNFSAIPGDLRSMARLWPNMLGLRIRRDAEADLFEKGLKIATNET